MKKLLILSIAMTTFMLVFIGQAADKPRFKVSVNVACDNKNTESFIESHIKRELRSLRDVNVVEFDLKTNDFNIRIAAGKDRIFGTESIYMLTSFYNFFGDDDVRTIMNFRDPQALKFALNATLGLRIDTYPLFDKVDNLDKVCKQIIVSFDTEKLDPLRQR